MNESCLQVNAGRVADYIRSQRDAQYLVVSHKPQVSYWGAAIAYGLDHRVLVCWHSQ